MFRLRRAASSFGVVALFTIGLFFLNGCGAGAPFSGLPTDRSGSGAGVTGTLHGGPNPIVGATISLYTTTTGSYGGTATLVTSTVSGTNGVFSLPTATTACPANEYAYVTAYGGTTGSKTNNTSLLMVPIGLCSANYTFSGGNNTYTGPDLFINEVTTAASAYALGNFMSVTDAGVVNIGAPSTNHHTASATSPSAAGLAHAFANALALVNINTGQPRAYTNGGTSATTGGLVPSAELLLLGNILQACVNSNGPTGTNTATSNDGTPCGKFYSLTTPPQGVASPLPVPQNTMQAMLDLARYPNPLVNTWDAGCDTAGSGTKSATSCIFGLATGIANGYPGALTSAPPDWALAVTYGSAYGAQTGNAGCTGTCPGIVYPYYVALDYQDNVYVLNQDASTPTIQNIIALSPTGAPLWATPNDSTYSQIRMLSTDTAGHVLGTNATTNVTTGTTYNLLRSFNTADGTLFASVGTGTSNPTANAVDNNNNVYYEGTGNGVNLRRFAYDSTNPTTPYTQQTLTPAAGSAGGALQISLDSNLNVFTQEPSASNIYRVAYALNVGTLTAPSYNAYASTTTAGSVVNAGAFGITMDSSGNAWAGSGSGFTKITHTITGTGTSATASLSAGTAILGTPLNNGTQDYFHYLFTDGSGNILGADNDNGGGPAGIQVLDVADAGTGTPISLGGYKGCVVSGTTCGTGLVVPAYSPRGMAIDSAGDVYVVSGANKTLAEYIGVAAPTWPGLSMLKTGKP